MDIKYFKYAFGEIVLVVIGILIALQINNWNEERKQFNEVDNVLELLQKELKSNIISSTGFLEYGYHIDSIQVLLNRRSVKAEDIRENPELITRSFGTRTIKFLDERVKEAITMEKQFPEEYNDLIEQLKEVNNLIEEHRYWESRALDFASKKIEEYINTYAWFGENDSASFETSIDFHLNDAIYRNNVRYYNSIQLNENVFYASMMRRASIRLLWKLKQAQSKEDISIQAFFDDLSLQPIAELDCSANPYPVNDIFFRRNIVVYNDRSDTVMLDLTDRNGEMIFSAMIPPKSFKPRGAILNRELFIMLRSNGDCEKVYQLNKEDYLLIE